MHDTMGTSHIVFGYYVRKQQRQKENDSEVQSESMSEPNQL